jgi:hypothetical protein
MVMAMCEWLQKHQAAWAAAHPPPPPPALRLQ